jgi:D-methionine transport system substrate-binding protein
MTKLTMIPLLCLFLCLSSCTQTKSNTLKIAVTPVPHAEMVEHIQSDLQSEGYTLELIITEDYNMPNRALAGGEIDANFFQHEPFLNEQMNQFDYALESMASIEIEPLGVYSRKIKSLAELKPGSKVAIANDPTNEARALLLLQKQGLIQLRSTGIQASLLEIKHNPHHLQFIELDAAMLPRTLEDVDIAVINTNYALGAGLSPIKEALVLESLDSPYANILVIRQGENNRKDLQALKKWMTSDKMKAFIHKRYQGAILPTF